MLDDAENAETLFDNLFCDLLPRLYRRAVMLVGADGSAQDAVHEVYLKVAPNPARLLRHPQPYAYLVTALVSVVRDDLRRRCRLSVVAEVPERGDATQVAESSEARWQAAWLLRHLSPGQAAAVRLVDLDGYTIDEAAAVLQVHRGTVSRARHRALAALRELVNDERR